MCMQCVCQPCGCMGSGASGGPMAIGGSGWAAPLPGCCLAGGRAWRISSGACGSAAAEAIVMHMTFITCSALLRIILVDPIAKWT